MKLFFSSLITLVFVSCSLQSYKLNAQVQTADKVVAVIGRNRIVLQSELEIQASNMKRESPDTYNDSLKYGILQQMIMSKILVEQADRDSLVISDEEIDGTLDNRIRYFISKVYGSKEKLEEITGKTVYQIKDENREIVKEQMMAERVQSQLIQKVSITPTEVRDFYNKIPKDSLPFLPATIEVGQIVVDPPISPELDEYARKALEGYRKEIIDSVKTFEQIVSSYSEDPGSKENGGRYNDVSRTDGAWAPEFVAAAFKLQPGEISPVVKTKFGYHIVQMIQRKGDHADVRHVLIIPKHTSQDYSAALLKLDSIRAELLVSKISFNQAVGKYSTDENSKNTGGMITNPQTGSSSLEVDQLDPGLALMVDSLKPGSYSQPHVFTNPQTGEKSCRIVYMKGRTAPHKANLKDDYSKIQGVALSQKQNQKLDQWFKDKLPGYYLKIDKEYQNKGPLAAWQPYVSQK